VIRNAKKMILKSKELLEDVDNNYIQAYGRMRKLVK
jgi:hypothetical protein